ncbi:hypothetical protein DSO57_1011667 [Entomophthora muscae]|uniref:Uncharacterized protein n=1 Tax=Entomophthora muscae TaxID=34485 RepID=A0ACC2RX87_9FUNG|nr:hypothetical protein DSO57_1011667 [Entomophthora muscae]
MIAKEWVYSSCRIDLTPAQLMHMIRLPLVTTDPQALTRRLLSKAFWSESSFQHPSFRACGL